MEHYDHSHFGILRKCTVKCNVIKVTFAFVSLAFLFREGYAGGKIIMNMLVFIHKIDFRIIIYQI